MNRSFAISGCVVGVLATSLGPRAALAQTTQSSTIAEALFQDAQARLTAGQIHEACDLFARSQKIEPTTGTLLNLAACHEREEKTATAWTEFSTAAAQALRAGDRPRAQFAATHIAALDKKLHRIVVEILEPAPEMKVTLDGTPLVREAWGTAIPLDPGEHTIEVHAPSFAPWVRKVNLGPASGTDRIEVRLVAEASPTPAVVDAIPPPRATEPAPLPPPPESPPSSPTNTKRIAGFIVGGVGVVGLGIAGAFGAAVVSNTNARNALCQPGVPCGNAQAFSDDHNARVDQTLMFVTGGVGLAALGVGTYLVVSSYLRKTPPERAQVSIVPLLGRENGMALEGSF